MSIKLHRGGSKSEVELLLYTFSIHGIPHFKHTWWLPENVEGDTRTRIEILVGPSSPLATSRSFFIFCQRLRLFIFRFFLSTPLHQTPKKKKRKKSRGGKPRQEYTRPAHWGWTSVLSESCWNGMGGRQRKFLFAILHTDGNRMRGHHRGKWDSRNRVVLHNMRWRAATPPVLLPITSGAMHRDIDASSGRRQGRGSRYARARCCSTPTPTPTQHRTTGRSDHVQRRRESPTTQSQYRPHRRIRRSGAALSTPVTMTADQKTFKRGQRKACVRRPRIAGRTVKRLPPRGGLRALDREEGELLSGVPARVYRPRVLVAGRGKGRTSRRVRLPGDDFLHAGATTRCALHPLPPWCHSA